MTRKIVWTAGTLVLLLALALTAQNTTTIEGTVTDEAGAPLAGAVVTIVNEATGEERKAVTDDSGRYAFAGVPEGVWEITVAAEGYPAVIRKAQARAERVWREDVRFLQLVAEKRAPSTLEPPSPAPPPPPPAAPARKSPPRLEPPRQLSAGGVIGGIVHGVPGGSAGGQLGGVLYGVTSTRSTSTEAYDRISENDYNDAVRTPLSTFSIDVDTASYANVRRFLQDGELPPKDAVRIEELINYFRYDEPAPEGEAPFSVTTEVARCPWNAENKIARIALRSQPVAAEDLPPANLVFLLDVSGSMNSPDKLPLLKKGFSMLVDQLRAEDRVAIVAYAGYAGLVLPSTAGSKKDVIRGALSRLRSGGSTAGAAGIQHAYKIAQENFFEHGNNRVILATDGDFNVGVSSDSELIRLIEEKRDAGVFLSVLGFGAGNLRDSKMEQLADHGNGQYGYVDGVLEARRQLVEQIGATLLTVAKDVKLQVEFNPARVARYRLVGYENRLLADEDFDDDKKDAGDMGAGHVVTALYEIEPADGKFGDDALRYQERAPSREAKSDELFQVRVRYKEPRASESRLLVEVASDSGRAVEEASDNLRFSAAVAEFGMLLRESEHRSEASYAHAAKLADGARGEDADGRRSELVYLIKTAGRLAEANTVSEAR